MQRAYWSADFSEAHVVEAMLRANDLHASVFDAGMARQDWFKTLAIGGYRVMVPDSQTAAARQLVADYHRGAMALPDGEVDAPTCPRCSADDVADDPRPRRAVFGTVIASQAAPLFLVSTPALWWMAGLLQFLPLLAFPMLGSRHRCDRCGTAFGAPRRRFESLARAVAEAQAATTGEPA